MGKKVPGWVWMLAVVGIAWGGMKVSDQWRARQEVPAFVYAQIAHEYPTSSGATKTLIRASMQKGYVNNQEFAGPILKALLDDHPDGIVMRREDTAGGKEADKTRLKALLQ